MVAITANVAVPLLGRDSFQEIDITGVTMPITKHNYIVKDITKLADTIREAFRIAQEGRPGPVLVDITKDVTAAETEYVKEEPFPVERSTQYIKEKDLAQEIVMNSRIAVRKQNLFKISLGITEMALVLLLIKTVESLLRMVIS